MFRVSMLTALFAALLCASAIAQNGIDGEPIPGQMVVQISAPESGALDDLIQDIEAITGEDTVAVVNTASRLKIYTIKFPVPNSDYEQEAIDDIFSGSEDSGNIVWYEANRLINVHGQTGSLWVSGVDINATSYQSQYATNQLDLGSTHAENARGAGTLVAIIDTGIDDTHPELSGRVSINGTNTIIEGGPTNDSGEGEHAGHGTFVAGLVSLVAPEALLLPVTVLKGDGTGFPVDIADGISHASSLGAHVIVLALGTTQFSNAIRIAIDDAISNGATVVAAAGNTVPQGQNACLFPASYNGSLGGNEGVFAVSANNDLDDLATVSNYHDDVRVCAPGESHIRSDEEPEAARSVIGPLPGYEYAAATGTSFSTALTAGVAALIRSQFNDWPNQQVPVGSIAGKVMGALEDSSVLISMPNEPGNQVDDKPRLDAFQATANGPAPLRLGDIDGDGWIDGRDLAVLLGGWGPLPNAGSLHTIDLLRDEVIDGGDLAILLGAWDPK